VRGGKGAQERSLFRARPSVMPRKWRVRRFDNGGGGSAVERRGGCDALMFHPAA
jgi:hypothetical protein